jgi:nitrate/TMAO reductase-like tetraheme cytochrome c subunit
MFQEKLFAVAAPLLFLLLMFPVSVFSEESADCISCHGSMKGRIKSQNGVLIELHVDADKFKASVHGTLTCAECHARFAGTAHASAGKSLPSNLLSLSSQLSSKFRVDAIAGAACIACHEETYQQVLSSVHGKNIIEKKQSDGALCIDCHGSPHYITKVKDGNSPMSRKYQVETCLHCHADKSIINKYNLEENVMDSFKESFHGRKLHLGHTRAPSCASCHNAHDIKTKTDPASPVFGKNKLETCGKCHKGANEKFVQAITHKRPGPIPHYGEKLLILLTIGTFAFIVLHVLLEVFADIREAVFRKKEGK